MLRGKAQSDEQTAKNSRTTTQRSNTI